MQTVAQGFENNARVREALRAAIAGLTDEQLDAHPEGEAWSIKEIVEHISIVDEGLSRICTNLVAAAKADGRPGNGKLSLSDEFNEKTGAAVDQRLEAPERVRPTSGRSIAESFARMEESSRVYAALREDIGAYDLSAHKFPHPYFGDLTAAEWFVLAGGHEMRHVRQIERVKAKL